ncbi:MULTISPECIES: bacteriocin immunity protein [Pseudomonas]|uniref:Colicin immunity protein/pyocin immunity protein n=5 Tax=Pseudomonas TaxID=286 RepID=A0A0Q0C340_PSESX|nr:MULTISPECIES: bacteriocin immunity protein [Pseudomonas]MCW6058383.1 bacteriocin immunity protein [Pseudomonas fragi]AAY39681.1 Colicin immunity protein/pyocin immunity protein [Pseudomonas syringae pv. syringae B728a]KOP60697.1 bacteriocin immunity protein [Pseudomonas coronafaciens pv. porri]KPZ01494.1 Colicin immunity protein/pyocin immunity protein [Pseudomonas syringae pv. spinaceae]MDV0428481.1 bacteriocin immunity protein [Pseudomonas sp. 17]
MEFKNKYEEYTEAEFLAFLEEFFVNKQNLEGDEYGQYISKLAKHFDDISEHPEKNGLIFYPAEGVEDSPAGVLKVLKEWRAANGKPDFKKA